MILWCCYVPQFKMVLIRTNVPHIPASEIDTLRRLKIVTGTYVVNPKKYYSIYCAGTNNKQYKIDEPDKVTQYVRN